MADRWLGRLDSQGREASPLVGYREHRVLIVNDKDRENLGGLCGSLAPDQTRQWLRLMSALKADIVQVIPAASFPRMLP